MANEVINDDDVPHSDSVLFKRIREWLRNDVNIKILSDVLQVASCRMLNDLKSRNLLLKFASVSQKNGIPDRSSLYINRDGKTVIDLHVPSAVGKGCQLHEIDNMALTAIALDALTLYARNESTHRIRANAPRHELL